MLIDNIIVNPLLVPSSYFRLSCVRGLNKINKKHLVNEAKKITCIVLTDPFYPNSDVASSKDDCLLQTLYDEKCHRNRGIWTNS